MEQQQRQQQQELEDAMFWLPPEFLNDEDDDVFISRRNKSTSSLEGWSSTTTTTNTETESDEEDYLDDLSRKLAYSALVDNNTNFTLQNKSTGSPQSTLCDFPLDVFYAAVGEQVAMLKIRQQTGYQNFPNPNSQIQSAQLKQQQMMKQQQMYQQFVQENRGRNGGGGNVKPVVAAPLSAWPTLQQSQQQQPPPGTGMRAVFLGNPKNPKRESTGTGVFLPRQIGAPTETRKKRGCSTVLLPDRVVNALNLNLEAQTRSNGGRFLPHYDAEMRYRNNLLMAEQRRLQMEKDFRLPQEWTY